MAVATRVSAPPRDRLGYVPALDGLRGVAILLVIGIHFRVPGFEGGHLGVLVFFVLSGYLITSLLTAERERSGRLDLPRFYARRALRLLPAIALLLACLLALRLATIQQASAVALYVANWQHVLGSPLGYLTHAWSLAVEEQFYLVWPLVLALALRYLRPRQLARFMLAIALGIGIARALFYLAGTPFDRLYFGSDFRSDGLLFGSALALWRPHLPKWLGAAAILPLALGVAHLTPEHPALYLGGFTAVGLAAAALVGHPPPILAWPPLVALGRVSYGLYLWHYPVSLLVSVAPWPIALALGLPVSLLLTLASWRYVESPCLRLKGRLRPSADRIAAPARALAGSK